MKKYPFTCCVLDLDGVVTQTAHVHAQAWKQIFDEYLRLKEKRDGLPFREFTHENDYLPYVDGIPRYDGVMNFLKSRGITIPFGTPEDTPDQETICGLGNKKNQVFNELLKKQGSEVYPSTIQFIKTLKKSGVRIGVASSSKNCQLILQSTGIEKLFETRVDGIVSEELGLRGKPEGDIFVTAAHNLGRKPAESIVVEDAALGVAAGRNGEFGLVLGVARKENHNELLENGADLVVSDLSEIDIDFIEKWFNKKPRPLFQNWDKQAKSADIIPEQKAGKNKALINPCYFLSGREVLFKKDNLVFFLDYDGTLTPIVERPELAVMSQKMRRIIQRLAQRHTVAIVSGRAREDVAGLVGIEGLIYAGSHGFDISGQGISTIQPEAKEAVPLIAQIAEQLSQKLQIPGLLLEEKKFSIAVHYRLVDEKKYLSKIKQTVEKIVQKHRVLRLMSGKKVFELLPAFDWDKGRAIRWIMHALNISWHKRSVIYIGDDTTDEDAFRMVRTRGVGILVADAPKESTADFQVTSVDEVKELFEKIIAPS